MKDIRIDLIFSIKMEEMVVAARGRWKIENEGFNNQENGLYRIEHINSKTAM